MDDATKLYTCKLISFLLVCTDSKINGVFAIVNDGATKLHQDTGQDGATDASASATSERKGEYSGCKPARENHWGMRGPICMDEKGLAGEAR